MLKMYLCKTYAEALSEAGRVAAELGKGIKPSVYAFCEDKLSMSLEREIARACGGGTFAVQVSTFNRFIKTHSKASAQVVDKESSAMIVKRILLENAQSLGCFKKSCAYAGTATALYELIAQLKSASVTPEGLEEGMATLDGALVSKIKDVVFVYREYERYIEERGLLDSNSYLKAFPDLVEGNYGDCTAMLVGYGSLTRQGVEIVKAIAENFKNLYVFLLSGENESLYTNELKVALMREIGGFSVVESNYEYSDEHMAMMNSLFDVANPSSRVETDRIRLYEAIDTEEEIKRMAKLISREVYGGARYRDLAVALGTPEDYRAVICKVFGDYGIPYFLDDKRSLSSHPIAKFIISYLDLIAKNFRLAEAIALIKSPFWLQDKATSDRVESFIYRNAITAKIIKNGLNPTKSPDKYGEGLEEFLSERERLMQGCQRRKTVGEYVADILTHVKALGGEAYCQSRAVELDALGEGATASFCRQGYGKIEQILSNVERVLGDTPISAIDMKNVLVTGFDASTVSVLPQRADCVYIGNYKDCKYLTHRVLFAGGLNGDVPFAQSDTAILTDKDLNRLEKYGCIVEPKIKIVNNRERENVGCALLSFGERLYLSRSATLASGKPAAKGKIFDYFTKQFNYKGNPIPVHTLAGTRLRCGRSEDFMRESVSLDYSAPRAAKLNYFLGLKDGDASSIRTGEAAYYDVIKGSRPLDAQEVDSLKKASEEQRQVFLSDASIFTERGLSASMLEKFFACPYACFMQYGLGLAEEEDGSIGANEYGTFLHAVVEDFVSSIKKCGKTAFIDKKSCEEEVDKILAKQLDDYSFAKYLEDDKYREIFELVKVEAHKVASGIANQYAGTKYNPLKVEAGFGKGAELPPIVIKTPNGDRVISGKIDRVDECGDRIRIIDYKTGTVHAETENFYTGQNIQLYLYMNAFLSGNKKPGGAYYYPVNNSFKEEGKKEEPLYQGLTAWLPQDEPLPEGEKPSDNPEKTFEAHMKYAMEIASVGATEIAEGLIAASPYESACTYCKYAPICGRDPSSVACRKEKGVTRDTVVGAVEMKGAADGTPVSAEEVKQ